MLTTHSRLYATAALLAFAAASTPPTSPKRGHAARCFDLTVLVSAESATGELGAPGVPVTLKVRALDGSLLLEANTTEKGRYKGRVCWSAQNPPTQIEAVLPIGAGRFYGALASFKSESSTYCINLPALTVTHCGDGGTGPDLD